MSRCFLFIGLITVLGITIRCKNNAESPSSQVPLTILYIGDERIFHQDTWGMEASKWIFLPLVTSEGDPKGVIHPVLAKSWTHTDDYKTWTVDLREDVYWHDGVQMTAHDIKFSLDLKKKVFGGYDSGLNCIVIDEFTFKLHNDKPISELPSWEVYYPKHLLEGLDTNNYYNWAFWKNPIGNGPYKFVRNIPKTMVEVEANPNYFGSPPKVKRAILKFSQSPSLLELLSGNVDAVTFAPRDFLFKLNKDSRFASYYWFRSEVETVFWNHNNFLFTDARVRKALTMAIDRAELSEVLNYPKNVPIADVIYSYHQRLNNDIPKSCPYNPSSAIELLKKCGWIDSDGDGTLDKNGIDFKFILKTSVNALQEHKSMPIYIQDKFRTIGINMEIETVDQSTSRQLLKKGDYDAVLAVFYNSLDNFQFIKTCLGDNSYLGYNNPELNRLFEQIEATGDKIKIDSLYKKTFPIFQRDMPVTFVLPWVQTHIVNKNIKGLQNKFKADPVLFLESLWIE